MIILILVLFNPLNHRSDYTITDDCYNHNGGCSSDANPVKSSWCHSWPRQGEGIFSFGESKLGHNSQYNLPVNY